MTKQVAHFSISSFVVLAFAFSLALLPTTARGQNTSRDSDNKPAFPQETVVGVLTFAAGKSIETDDLATMNPSSHGGGAFIRSDGRILTVRHILDDLNTSRWKVWARTKLHPEGKLHLAKLLAADTWSDLAVLKIELEEGDECKRIRLPFKTIADYGRSQQTLFHSSLQSLINGTDPESGVMGPTEHAFASSDNVYQHGGLFSILSDHGTSCSGMPIFKKGKMIGLTTAEVICESGEPQSFGFVNFFWQYVTMEYLNQGMLPEYGFLGVTTRDLSDGQKTNGLIGVQIVDVDSKSPADDSGLKFSDVITHWDHQPVDNSQKLNHFIGHSLAGQVAKVTIQRGALNGDDKQPKELTLEITLSKRRIQTTLSSFQSAPRPAWRGMQVEYPSAVENYRAIKILLDKEGCVVANEVEMDSLAWQAGLRPGSVIRKVAGERVTNPAEFFRLLNPDRAESVTLLVVDEATMEPVQIVVPAK